MGCLVFIKTLLIGRNSQLEIQIHLKCIVTPSMCIIRETRASYIAFLDRVHLSTCSQRKSSSASVFLVTYSETIHCNQYVISVTALKHVHLQENFLRISVKSGYQTEDKQHIQIQVEQIVRIVKLKIKPTGLD